MAYLPTFKTLLCILGPTASGKTAAAIRLAKKHDTVILSADSRQFYREMNIGTAKPSHEELAEVEHYFIDNLSIHEHYTAGKYEKEALALLKELFLNKDTIILAGGSTLYIRALLEGIDEMPEVNDNSKREVDNLFKTEGIEGLQKQIQIHDPDYFSLADTANHRRMIRALEVCISSGKPYSSFLNHTPAGRPFNIEKTGIEVPREELYQRINLRCEDMLKVGLLEEVKSLYEFRHLIPLHTVGYTEFFDYLDGKTTYEQTVELFKQHTRNYAKRQMTWFRKEKDIKWLPASEI